MQIFFCITYYNSCLYLQYIVIRKGIYLGIFQHFQIDEIPGIKIFKCKSPIYFANIDYFKEKLRDEVSLLFAQILNSEILK